MKRYFILLLVLGACWMGCDENEIAIYQESTRLTFAYAPDVYFADTDYVAKRTEVELKVSMQIQGYPLEEERTYCLVAQPADSVTEMPEVVLADSYVFPANKYTDSITIVVKRPAKPSLSENQTSVELAFDTENPAHEFEPGQIERQTEWFWVTFYLPEPAGWSPTYFGVYSMAKYMFMMDCFGEVYRSGWNNYAHTQEVVEAYQKYCETHEELLDDEGNPIAFPQVP